MQWKTITSNLGSTAIGLWNNGQKIFTLAYKTKSDTVYLQSEQGERRLFHYRKKGLFKNKLVLENEYGANLGILKKEGHEEYIEVDNKRYFLNYTDTKHVQIMDENTQKPLAVCSLEYDNPNPNTDYSLLMVLCLYIFRGEKNIQQGFSLN